MKYKYLEKGEIIKAGDEVNGCNDPWRDKPKWVLTTCIGEAAPDPSYISHSLYRRRIYK